MKLDQLAYFVETARFEHIGKAAKSLAISPSAISHAIANLEEELGLNLFEKMGKRIFLTARGKAFVGQAQQVLDGVENLKHNFASENLEISGHFRLAATHVLGASLLVPAFASVAQNTKDLTAEVYSVRSAQVVAGVASGEFDFGICFSPLVHPALDTELLKSGTLRIAVRPHHPLIKKRPRDWLNAIRDYPCVMPKALHGIDVCESHPAFKEHNLEVNPALIYDSYDIAVSFVMHTDSWAFLPDWIAAQNKLFVPPHPRKWQAPYRVCLVSPKIRIPSRLINVMADFMKNA